MNIYLKNVIVSLSILGLCFSLRMPIVIARSSTQLGSAFHIGVDPEIELDINITRTIASYSKVASYGWNYYWYGHPYTNSTTICEAAQGADDVYSTSFYIGHSGSEGVWHYVMIPVPPYAIPFYETQWFISAWDGTKVYDENIFPYSSSQYVKAVFLWACMQGEQIGGTHWSGAPFGMPYAWLHTTSLSNDGYANPNIGAQVFLGFNDSSPFLVRNDWTDGGIINEGPYKFLQAFYFASLCFGAYYTVNDALDYAALEVWNAATFSDSVAYRGCEFTDPDGHGGLLTWATRMVVYGNGDIRLSDSGALCSAKGTTSGSFYVPINSPNMLKIDSLFDYPGITGDQKGGQSPYGSMQYPDGKVDITDLGFVTGKFGLHDETNPNWDYMADVYPDRKIDIQDTARVSANFGHANYAYIRDLSNVIVHFNTLDDVAPDYAGFVNIPSGATSFTVKRNGSPMGATIIFWDAAP